MDCSTRLVGFLPVADVDAVLPNRLIPLDGLSDVREAEEDIRRVIFDAEAPLNARGI